MKDFHKEAKKFAKLFLKKIRKVSIRTYKKGIKEFSNLEAHLKLLSLLVVILIIGIAGLMSVLSVSEDAPVNVEDYPFQPNSDIEFSCTDSEINPAETTVRGGDFVRFYFKNESSKPASFSILRKDGAVVDSTISIAPNTIASFSWRVPATLKDKTLVSRCSFQGSEIVGEIKFKKK